MKIFSPFLPIGLPGSQAGARMRGSLSLTHTHSNGVNTVNAAQTTTSKLIIILFQGSYNSSAWDDLFEELFKCYRLQKSLDVSISYL